MMDKQAKIGTIVVVLSELEKVSQASTEPPIIKELDRVRRSLDNVFHMLLRSEP